MKRKLLSFMALSLFAVGCQSSFVHEVTKSDNGVVIQKDSLLIRVEVIDNGIVHVTKSVAGAPESTIPDYVTVLEPQGVKWSMRSKSDEVVIMTPELKVTIDADGIISYQKADGKHLVSESNEVTYIDPSKSTGNAVSQSFTVGDEALFGLGQYQSGIMNWKNVSVRMEQFNQEVAIPFLMSTNNYGIYWNNYSITDFNKAENEIIFGKELVDAKPIEVVKQSSTTTSSKPTTHTETENVIQAKSKIKDAAKVREAKFTPDQTGYYTFFVKSNNTNRMRGDIKLLVDGDPVINYTTIWVPTTYSGKKYLEAGKEYDMTFYNTGASIPGQVFYNKPDYNKTVFSSDYGSSIDYYIVAGDSPADVLALNNKLTGNAPMFNRKAYGFWQCRERYHDQAELLENAYEMRKREIPVDMIIQDWFYWPDGQKGPEWDRAKYPDAAAMAKEVHDLNMEIMVSVWPEVSNESVLKTYGVTDRRIGGKPALDVYDDKVGEAFYQMLSDSMFHNGINSIWLDGSEPSARPSVDAKTAVGDFGEVANTYSLRVSEAVYNGKRKEYPNERPVNLTRSAFVGQQRYGMVTWSGDTAGTWEQFEEQITAGVNFTMAGVPYWTHDIGGFFRDANSMNPIYDNQYTNPEYVELLARWFQFGAFCPIFRIHGYVSETEIWRYGAEFEAMARKFIETRYQLLPYIYSQAWGVTSKGRTLMSPVAYHYPHDKNTWIMKDQIFFGESMMVCLVTDYEQREKNIYLPKDIWYDFWTGEKMNEQCGRTLVDTPFDSTPIYVRGGSIIPIGPKLQYADEPTEEPTLIRVYPGKDGEYTLYLDDNFTNDYERGVYSEVEFTYSEGRGELTISKGEGDYIDFTANPMTFVVEMVGQDGDQTVAFDGSNKKVKF
ncbi:MAG: TIM-barrel domain-containing protein [Rikenellaceae bacterium]